jgi:hypothetical protein
MDIQLGGNFSILGSYQDVDKIIVGVIATESGAGLNWGNVDVAHRMVPATSGFGLSFEQHQVTQNARKSLAVNQSNLSQGRLAQSLLGTMGAYLIRGLQLGPKGFGHVQNNYKSVAEAMDLLVNPGESITARFTQDADGLRRGLFAGLCILETNYKIFLKKYPGNKTAAIEATIRSHLGDPNSVDAVTGISSGDYLSRVMNSANSYAGGSSKYMGVSNNSVKVAQSTGYRPGTSPGCGVTPS